MDTNEFFTKENNLKSDVFKKIGVIVLIGMIVLYYFLAIQYLIDNL